MKFKKKSKQKVVIDARMNKVILKTGNLLEKSIDKDLSFLMHASILRKSKQILRIIHIRKVFNLKQLILERKQLDKDLKRLRRMNFFKRRFDSIGVAQEPKKHISTEPHIYENLFIKKIN